MSSPKSQGREERGSIVTFASAGGPSLAPASVALTVTTPAATGRR